MHLSIITPTYQRRRMLASTLNAVKNQQVSGITLEHIVISDGPDPFAAKLAKAYGVTYLEVARDAKSGKTDMGGRARDAGIEAAKGQYLCFFDDDNYYEPHAVASLLSCAWGNDLGVCKVKHFDKTWDAVIPVKADGVLRYSDIDTACICISKEVAKLCKWQEVQHPAQDFNWLSKLSKLKPSMTIRYSPLIVATHIPAFIG